MPGAPGGRRLLKAEGPSQLCPASSVSVTGHCMTNHITAWWPNTLLVISVPVGQECGFARSSSSGTLVRLLRARPRHLLVQPWGGNPLPRMHRGCWQVPRWLLAGDLASWASLGGGSNGAVGFIKVNERGRQTDTYTPKERRSQSPLVTSSQA